jgi:hypothetical protein
MDISGNSADGDLFSVDKEEIQRRVKVIVDKLDRVSLENPISPSFLGPDIRYPERKTRLFSLKDRPPNLSELRKELNRISESTGYSDTRDRIKNLLKKYPTYADLRALNAIQIFSDLSQAGLQEKKLAISKSALIEIALAMHNGAVSVYNVTWLTKIYIRYLEILRDRMNAEVKSAKQQINWKVNQKIDEMRIKQRQVDYLLTIKDKLGGLTTLNNKLKGSDYVTDLMTKKTIQGAFLAAQKGSTIKIGSEKSPAYILLMLITISLLLARMPIFRKLIENILITIPDLSKSVVLQKTMINNMILVTDFQLAMAAGDQTKSKQYANELYHRCSGVYNGFVKGRVMTKPYEVDPILKMAWISKESKGLIEKEEYKNRLLNSLKLLNILSRNREEVKGAFELTVILKNQIELAISELDWSLKS